MKTAFCVCKKVDNLATQRLENSYLAEWRDAHQTGIIALFESETAVLNLAALLSFRHVLVHSFLFSLI